MDCMPETMPKALGGCCQPHLKDKKAEVQNVNTLVKVTQPAELSSDLELCGLAGALPSRKLSLKTLRAVLEPQAPWPPRQREPTRAVPEGLWSVGACGSEAMPGAPVETVCRHSTAPTPGPRQDHRAASSALLGLCLQPVSASPKLSMFMQHWACVPLPLCVLPGPKSSRVRSGEGEKEPCPHDAL